MAWIRTVKPELFIHEFLYEIESRSGLPIRFAFIGLFTQCDREGRFKWRPRTLKLGILPYDEVDFNLVMNKLLEHGFVNQYEVNGELYGYIPTWLKHQVINNRERDSQIPEPPPNLQCLNSTSQLRVTHASITHQAHVDHESPTPLGNASGEWNGKEGKGTDICEVSNETSSVSANQKSTVMEIFNYWQSVMSRPEAKLDNKRKKKIAAALKLGFTLDQLKCAIDGCAATPYNMGENQQGLKYNDIELILRDVSRIEMFIQNIEIITESSVSRSNQIFVGAI